MIVLALALALMGFSGPQDDPCAARPADCRMVAFDVRVGDQSHPFSLAKPQPWVVDGRLLIFPGESVVLSVAADGGLSVISGGRADAVLPDANADAMIGVFAPGGEGENVTGDQAVPSSNGPKLVEPSPKTVRVTFRQAASGEDMLLVIQNGYDDALTYNAGMMVRGREGAQWSATSVCTVLPGIYAFEHWPHPMFGLSLGGFTLDASAPRDQVCCG